jgi:outer membrane protein OmpA-like peptidoglycan-associated protein
MKSISYAIFSKFLLLFPIIWLEMSCSTVPTAENSLLTEASEVYAQASADPNTASLEALAEAKSALEKAKTSKDNETKEHFAYLAKGYAQIAITVAKRQALELERKNLLQPVPSLREHNNLNVNNQQLQQQIANWQRNPNEQLVLILEDIWSKTEPADLLPEARLSLNMVARVLNQDPELQVIVRSYEDNAGYDQYDLGLSERRAYAVEFALINRGIRSNRIRATQEGLLPTHNQTATKHKQNNRVEIIIFKAANKKL